ncbi:M28 family peptidase [soil metagenome]
MKNNISKLFLFLLVFTVLFSCDTDRERVTETVADIPVNVPAFNEDSAFNYIQQQVNFGPRVPNTRPHREAGKFLAQSLADLGWKVTEQEFEATAFDGTVLQLKNIIASYNPDITKRVLLASHWDSRPFADKDTKDQHKPIDGANDGASGVGVLLEIARAINENEDPRIGVDIIFFDGEDYGAPEDYEGRQMEYNGYCLGSKYWGNNKHEKNYSAYYGILLDMVGAPNARFYREGHSMDIAPSIVKKVWDRAHSLGHGQYFIYKDGSPITDDHLFVYERGKIPMIDIIDYDPENIFADYHHTHDDNISLIEKSTLKAVGETVLHVIYHEN